MFGGIIKLLQVFLAILKIIYLFTGNETLMNVVIASESCDVRTWCGVFSLYRHHHASYANETSEYKTIKIKQKTI